MLPHHLFHSGKVYLMQYDKVCDCHAEEKDKDTSCLRLMMMLDAKNFGQAEYHIKRNQILIEIEV